MIGDRVRHARLYLGWTGQQLAERANTTQPRIADLERGGFNSAGLVDAIAVATGFSRWWFEAGPLPDLPTGSLRFRKHASTTRRDDERVRAHVRQAVEVVERLGDRPEAPPVRIAPCRPDAVTDLAAVEEIAQATRETLGVGPTDRIPNLVRAVERAGVVVIGSVVEIDRHDGASFWPDYPIGRPIICVSRGKPGDRQRFSVAHELGHLILHQLRSNIDPKRAEDEAHRFAGALLVPAESAISELIPPVTLRSLGFAKARWGISIQALIKRCLDLNIIDSARRDSLEKQISARGWRKTEPVEVPAENPKLLRRLIEISGSSVGKVHELTGLPPLAGRDLVA